jgi:hypothetical protein
VRFWEMSLRSSQRYTVSVEGRRTWIAPETEAEGEAATLLIEEPFV